MSAELRDQLVRYCFALFCTIFAAWMRRLCGPAFDDRLPFGFFMLAVVFTAWLAGPAPAIVSLVLGTLAAIYVAVPPVDSWAIAEAADWLAMVIYLVAGTVTIVLFHRLARQQDVVTLGRDENEQLTKNLVVADRRRHDYLALLAHELRNPLSPLQTGLEILRRGDGSPQDSKRLLNVMTRQLEHVTRLLDDLLDVTRFARGHIRFHRQVLDLRCAAKTAVEAVQPHMEACEHRFTCRVSTSPVWIRGDRVRLVQIMSNLLSNAAKYTPPAGRIEMHVRTSGKHAVLEVTDNGIGIASEDQQRVFSLFSQVESPSTRSEQGLGIGLSLVRQLVRAHGGTIEVRSEGPGCGTAFVVQFPLVDQPAVNDQPQDGDPCEPLSQRAGAHLTVLSAITQEPAVDEGPQRVLVVDDNHDAAETLASLLAFEGKQVQVVQDGPAALEAAPVFRPHVILLDIGLPGMDGFEVARRVRGTALEIQPRILAVSGWGGAECEQQARDAGIDEHWLKPIDAAAMVNRLEQLRCAQRLSGDSAASFDATFSI